MADSLGPVYEVTHSVNAEVVADFDAWLGQHLEDMLAIPGISRAAMYTADDHEDGRSQRVSQYHFESDTDLENYLSGPAEVMRMSANEHFEGLYEVSRRILHECEVVDGALKTAAMCLNCGSTLTGQYCGNCGQRATSRLISIWQLLREAFGDLLELDSRLWRTLIPLAIGPGKLTRDYLEGRRARFMPPFRTYLVLSIVFFVVAFFDPSEEFSFFFGSDAAVPEATAARGDDAQQLVDDDVLPAEQADIGTSPGSAASNNPVADAIPDEGSEQSDNAFNIRFSDGETTTTDNCDDIETDEWPAWLETRLTPERLKVMCERVVADDGQALGSKLLDNVPAALIALLPLMALVLKALYPLSKRYYVEHLLFVVHYHAFVFLILSLQILFDRLASVLGLPGGLAVTTMVAVSLYIPVYLFRAMRRVYEQGWLLTLLKYLVLLIAYFVGTFAILGVTAAIAAFSI